MTEYNPADHTVEDVKSHVEENPAEAEAVLKAEQDGENRSTLVKHLEKVVGDDQDQPDEKVVGDDQDQPDEKQHEAPVPVEATAVTVEPSATPTVNYFGKEYEVTPEGGHKLKA